jgi:hypothetical protein
MSGQKQMLSLELLEQREEVQDECIKLQALIDDEIPDSSFMWHLDANCVNIFLVKIGLILISKWGTKKVLILLFFRIQFFWK